MTIARVKRMTGDFFCATISVEFECLFNIIVTSRTATFKVLINTKSRQIVTAMATIASLREWKSTLADISQIHQRASIAE